MYFIYFQAENTSTDCHKILNEAVEAINDSVELWTKLLSFYVNYDSLEMAIEAFQEGVRSLMNKSMPLWDIIILYMQNTHPKLVRQNVL